MNKLPIVIVVAVLLSACTAMRTSKSKTADDIRDVNVCVAKNGLAEMIGDVDDTIAILGGGRIEIHDVMLRNPETTSAARAWLISISSLGIADMTAAATDAVYDCSEQSNSLGIGAKCDFKALRYYVHYADEKISQASCIEVKELWVGTNWYAHGDNSKCPIEYKNELARLIDTSEFPNAIASWPAAASMTVHEQLLAMANDHRQNCKP